MALVLVVGLPSSGRSTRARQLQRAFQERVASSSTGLLRSVAIVSDDDVNNAKSLYATQALEKPARAAYLSACFRAIEQDCIVIADGGAGTNIKGFRYQLWCQAREQGVRFVCVHVHAPPSRCKAWNEARKEKGEASYESQTMDSMLLRFEEPDAMSRWDSPLVFIPAPVTSEATEGPSSTPPASGRDPVLPATAVSSFIPRRRLPRLTQELAEQRMQGASSPANFIDPLIDRIAPMRLTSDALASLTSDTQGPDPPGVSSVQESQSPEGSHPASSDPFELKAALIDEIWTLATEGTVVKAPGVVVPQQRTTSNYMSILESASQQVILAIQTLQATLGLPPSGGLVLLPLPIQDDELAGGKHLLQLELHLPANRTVTVAALQRLRRQFVKLHSSGLSSGGEISGAAVGGDASTADGGRMLLRGQASVEGNGSWRTTRKGVVQSQAIAKRGKRAGAGDTEADVARRFVLWLEGAL